MRIFALADGFRPLTALPAELPAAGYLWVALRREQLREQLGLLQAALQGWGIGPLVDLHVSDLLNQQLPSHFDYTSWYDLLVFRRLAAGAPAEPDIEPVSAATAAQTLAAVDTNPVGFAVFDRVLITVHPGDCQVRDFFIARLEQMSEGHAGARLPASPADLMLRIVNHMVDGYLALRRLLTRDLTALQQELLGPRPRHIDWHALLAARNTLHHLEDLCEDQRSAVQEWIDALAEWPAAEADDLAQRERELLSVRSRDVLEHIERVLSHVRRLEASIESAVQMHFSALGQRTNDIMRTLTVLTAIFLPLNLITGIFGMNFDALPLIHSSTGFWVALAVMIVVAISLGGYFWRKRYLASASGDAEAERRPRSH